MCISELAFCILFHPRTRTMKKFVVVVVLLAFLAITHAQGEDTAPTPAEDPISDPKLTAESTGDESSPDKIPEAEQPPVVDSLMVSDVEAPSDTAEIQPILDSSNVTPEETGTLDTEAEVETNDDIT